MAAGKGVIAGHVLMPREIGEEAHNYWQGYELTKSIATCLAESTGALGAYHDNYADAAMTILASRDCGAYQKNIPASAVGTDLEFSLRTESPLEADWRPVFKTNVKAAAQLYNAPWAGGRKRLWQPWVAYTTGWARFPEWWVWHQDADGKPVGPWMPTGRYIQRAIAGQMNMHVVIKKDMTAKEALALSARYLEKFGVKGTLFIEGDILKWKVPPKPTVPPKDGVGPRPVPNDGV